MLPDRMKKGEYLIRDARTASKIARVKKHPEYSDERVYIIQGNYGILSMPYDATELLTWDTRSA